MTTKKISPTVQSAQSDLGLYAEWRRLCLADGCDEADLDGTEAALQELPVELARERLTQAIRRLSGAAR